ncbi:MAG TPA: cytochrome c oxidase assembly protein [Acidimicrobiia bacterium]|jgi:putative membrane protein|nr:cytochrome c oxidase assembly protein [Acidimicrobiia bacterium]
MQAATFSEVVTFHLHLDVVGLVVAAGVFYEYAIRRLAPHFAPRGEIVVTRLQRVLFYSGLAVILIVSGYPLHDIGENSLFIFHMVEHLGLSLVAPPLLLYGTPWWLMRMIVKPILPVMRVLTHPVVALVLFNTMLAVLHLPGVLTAMLESESLHFFIHALLFVTAILMWWPVVGPVPDLPQLEPFQKMGYLFLQSLVPTVPASFLTLGDTPLYPIYETFPRLWGISAHTDQVVAGLIMKLGGGLILWAFIAAVFFSWWADEQKYGAPIRAVRRV